MSVENVVLGLLLGLCLVFVPPAIAAIAAVYLGLNVAGAAIVGAIGSLPLVVWLKKNPSEELPD